jgi:hypothetical protein
LFWDDDKEDRASAEQFTLAVDSLSNRRSINRLQLVGLFGNLVIWGIVIFFPFYVYRLFDLSWAISNKLGAGILGIPLMLTVFSVYSIFRRRMPNLEDQKLESEMMASFGYQEQATKRWRIWIFSFVIGIINTFLLVSIDFILTNRR